MAAFRAGRPIDDLLWQMRIKSHGTLAHYLQEVAELEIVPKLPPESREAIDVTSKLFRRLTRAY